MTSNRRLVAHLKSLSPGNYKLLRKAMITIIQNTDEIGPEWRFISLGDLLKAIYTIEKNIC